MVHHTHPKVKICGIRTLEILDILIEQQVDYAGLVFFEKSPRHLSVPEATKLSRHADRHIKRVGLFVDETIDHISRINDAVHLDMLQLHGKESLELIEALKQKTGLPIIKAIGVGSMDDISASQIYWQHAIMLFDAKASKSDLAPGGLGRGFNYDCLKQSKNLPEQWWLAGGLQADNINMILQDLPAHAQPDAVDLSSSVEESVGVKSVDKITRLMANIRAAQS